MTMAQRCDILDVGFKAKGGERRKRRRSKFGLAVAQNKYFVLVQGRAPRERPQRRRALLFTLP